MRFPNCKVGVFVDVRRVGGDWLQHVAARIVL
jgi:hypothetical protein